MSFVFALEVNQESTVVVSCVRRERERWREKKRKAYRQNFLSDCIWVDLHLIEIKDARREINSEEYRPFLSVLHDKLKASSVECPNRLADFTMVTNTEEMVNNINIAKPKKKK